MTNMDHKEYRFDIWQGGIVVASGSGYDAEAVCSEMVRYAAQYVQDGPIKITGSPELAPPGPARGR
jgi:hypothetical protein